MSLLLIFSILILNVSLVISNHCYYAITDIENKVVKADSTLETRAARLGERISHIEEVLEKLELHSPSGKQITTGNLFVIERMQTIKGRYKGCFKDLEENRMFRGFVKKYRYNSVDKCVDTCLDSGFMYAGMSLHYCYCGNAFPHPDLFPKSDEKYCDANCFGNSTQFCGDWNNIFNSVYETGVELYTFDTSGNEVTFRLPASSPKIQFKVRDECSHCYDDD
ncbi:sialate:O-sulfotransferase 1-like [Culicoides brevitarsis]|uniref:sialate:O-sulfotransferase 1-like n=1 Tax=Culicoides brevitarsis TaxID=469753 RepID=UPI00307C5ED8